MSTPNPLVPEGSLQQSKGKSNVKIAVCTILAIHAVLLVGLLMQGCKEKPKQAAIPEDTATSVASTTETATSAPPLAAPMDTGAMAALPTTTAVPATTTTVPVAAPTAVTPTTATTTVAPTLNTAVAAPVYTPDLGAAATAKEYAIASGDTLGKIAKENHISLKTLLEANPSVNPTKLKIGQKIQIPASTATASTATTAAPAAADAAKDESLYVVKSGDVLERIAKLHGTSVKAIKTANSLKTDRLKVGQKLKLPAAKTATASVDTTPVAPANPLETTTLTPTATTASR